MMEQINLLPWRQLKATRQRHYCYCRCLAALLVTGLLLTLLFMRLNALHQQQQKIYKQVQQQHGQQPTISQHSFALPTVLQTTLKQQRRQMAQQLFQIAHLIPKGVYLQQLHWHQQKLILTGSALSYPLLITLMNNLGCHQKQHVLQLESAIADKSQTVLLNFSLQLTWKISTV